ncbi:response regulator [Spirosoma pollinicola]|uniref:DNA-binding response regulator n=1 Tax=Spirosoma pollinicola TaxID=2057025 RepID=A0A2K8Z8C1_9BACT|nr:response regulator transcription factor [Spirosoma pollinicola]AUD06125.1 DNA-binding response regulator [Spirosoma pollinicola]
MEMIRVLLADDHDLLLESLALLLSQIEQVAIVGTVSDGKQALQFLEQYEVDIVLADLNMPVLNGLGLVSEIRQHHPKVRVILLTMVEEAAQIREAIQIGVDGYLLKKSNRVEVERAIRAVAEGQTYFSVAITRQLAQLPNEKSTTGHLETNQIETLTHREREILVLIIQDLTNQQIAEQLFISPLTVETHRRNLFRKLNVSSALGLMRYALRNGIAIS